MPFCIVFVSVSDGLALPVFVPSLDLCGGFGFVFFPDHLHQFFVAGRYFVAGAEAGVELHQHEVRVLHVRVAFLDGAVERQGGGRLAVVLEEGADCAGLVQPERAQSFAFAFGPEVVLFAEVIAAVAIEHFQMLVERRLRKRRQRQQVAFPVFGIDRDALQFHDVAVGLIVDRQRQSDFVGELADLVNGRIELGDALGRIGVGPDQLENVIFADRFAPVVQQQGEQFFGPGRAPLGFDQLAAALQTELQQQTWPMRS